MLGRLRVGPHQTEHHIGVVGAGGPNLLPIDDEFVAREFRPRAQRRQVRARPRFGIALAPNLFSIEDFGQVALLLLLSAPCNQRWAEHRDAAADRAWGA